MGKEISARGRLEIREGEESVRIREIRGMGNDISEREEGLISEKKGESDGGKREQ